MGIINSLDEFVAYTIHTIVSRCNDNDISPKGLLLDWSLWGPVSQLDKYRECGGPIAAIQSSHHQPSHAATLWGHGGGARREEEEAQLEEEGWP